MALPIIGDIFKLGMEILTKVLPDPAARAAAALELFRAQQAGTFKEIDTALAMAQGQMEINKIEAGSANLWVSGWRPGAGWVCVAGLAAAYLGQPMLAWVSGIYHWPAPPKPDMSDLIYLLGALLGLGGMHMAEKIKGA